MTYKGVHTENDPRYISIRHKNTEKFYFQSIVTMRRLNILFEKRQTYVCENVQTVVSLGGEYCPNLFENFLCHKNL